MDIDEITKTATELGITLTSAKEGTQIYQCWADRVQLAYTAKQRGDEDAMQDAIDDANNYAITESTGTCPITPESMKTTPGYRS